MKRLSAASAAARVKLGYLADSLQAHRFFGPAQSIRDFLAGKFESLDEAFGLVVSAPRRGKRADPDRGLLIAREIDPLKREGKTWAEIGEALDRTDSPGKELSVGQLRRVYEAHFDIDAGGVPDWARTTREVEAISDKLDRHRDKRTSLARPIRAGSVAPKSPRPARSKKSAGKSAG